MSASSCRIVLENYNKAYAPGEVIFGRVECRFNSEKKVSGIYVQLSGKASVRWEEKVHNDIITYQSEETYFSTKVEIVKNAKYGTVIRKGFHKYHFHFILPKNIPSSIEAEQYNIRYDITGVIGRPWKFDYVAKERYRVHSKIDLNTIPDIEKPISFSHSKITRSCCIKTGCISVEVALPKMGFLPEEDILLKIFIANNSPLDVQAIKIDLVSEIEYTAKNPYEKTLQDTVVLLSVESDGVVSNEDKTYSAILKAPEDVDIVNLSHCNIIKFNPKILIKIILTWRTQINLKIPIVLGEIPIKDSTNL